jgi:hypothetical protein
MDRRNLDVLRKAGVNAVGLYTRLLTRKHHTADPSAVAVICGSQANTEPTPAGRRALALRRGMNPLISFAYSYPQQPWLGSRTVTRQTGLGLSLLSNLSIG